jgi:RNA polymerase sigma factor (sigma-70 family)
MTPPRELDRVDDACGAPVGGSGGVLTRARSADDWRRLIEGHHHRVVLGLVASGFEFDRARDLANEAWARLMEKDRTSGLGEIKLPGLAIVQARFLAWEERRREAKRTRHQPDDSGPAAEELVVDRQPSPEQRLLSRQQVQRALEVVAASGASTQRLFRLLYAEPSLSHARAAEQLGLSVQRVRQILCELRKRVRAVMEGDRS